ncbi:unnamed protein product, partial [Ectocarpus sp. 12 AP-2014]
DVTTKTKQYKHSPRACSQATSTKMRVRPNHVDGNGRPASGEEMDSFSCHEGQESERSPPSRQADILLGGDGGEGKPQTGKSVRRKLVPYNIKQSTGAVGFTVVNNPPPPPPPP